MLSEFTQGWGRCKPTVGYQIDRESKLAAGLVGCWLFNEGGSGTAYDLSGNNTTATLNSGSSWKSGQFGPAVNFDGSNGYVSTSYASTLNPGTTGKVTASCWVNFTTVPGASTGAGVFGKWSTTGSKKSWLFYFNDGGSPQTLVFFAVQSNTTAKMVDSGFVPTAGKWYHLVGTADGSNVNLYINGQYKASTAYDGTLNNDTGIGITVGRLRPEDNVFCLSGLVDEPLVWNRALSATEIQELYARPFSLFVPRRSSFWSMQAVSSGNTYNETMNGGVLGGGSATTFADYFPQPSSGGGCGGSAGNNGQYSPPCTGGAYGAGQGVIFCDYFVVGSSGAYAAGSGNVFADYNILGTSGALGGGNGTGGNNFSENMQGGAYANGAAVFNAVFVPAISQAGCWANGSGTVRLVCNPTPTGGVWCNGAAAVPVPAMCLSATLTLQGRYSGLICLRNRYGGKLTICG